jgi:hypothetical protein
LLAANLPLLPRRLQLPVALSMDLLLPPSSCSAEWLVGRFCSKAAAPFSKNSFSQR